MAIYHAFLISKLLGWGVVSTQEEVLFDAIANRGRVLFRNPQTFQI